MLTWYNYEETKPPVDQEVLAQNDSWIDEFNPEGIRIGYLEGNEEGTFRSVVWDNYQGTWYDDDKELPTRWIDYKQLITWKS